MDNEEQFKFVKYDKKYSQHIRELWKEAYDQTQLQRREKLFKWLIEKNPFTKDGESPYFFLLHGNKLIGMLGHMPLDFSIQGKAHHGHISQDILISKEYRGKGLGKVLVKGVMDQSSSMAGAIWFNEPNHHLYMKSGWLDIRGLYPFLKIFDPIVFIKHKIRNPLMAKLLSLAAKPVMSFASLPAILKRYKTNNDIQIIEINEFDEEIDNFFDTVSKHLGIAVVRNQKYLNWKFKSKPFSNYKRFIAYDDNGKILGYVVLKREFRDGTVKGKILDILSDPLRPKVFQALTWTCVKYLKRAGASYVEILCTFPMYIKELKTFGFIRSKKPQPFMISNWEELFQRDKEFVSNINNWYLTFSEADGDSWEVDPAEVW